MDRSEEVQIEVVYKPTREAVLAYPSTFSHLDEVYTIVAELDYFEELSKVQCMIDADRKDIGPKYVSEDSGFRPRAALRGGVLKDIPSVDNPYFHVLWYLAVPGHLGAEGKRHSQIKRELNRTLGIDNKFYFNFIRKLQQEPLLLVDQDSIGRYIINREGKRVVRVFPKERFGIIQRPSSARQREEMCLE